MKILIIDNAPLVKSGDKYLTNSMNGHFFSELKELGNDVSCFQLQKKVNSAISNYDLTADGIHCYTSPLTSSKLLTYIIAFIKLFLLIPRYDFIYIYYPNSFKYAGLYCKMIGVKFGFYIRGEKNLFDQVSIYNYKKASLILTVSQFFTDNIRKYNKTTSTIRPMIPYQFEDIIDTRSYKPKHNYKILFLSRVSKSKGIDDLLYAMKMLKSDKINVTLEVVGNGEYIEDAKKLTAELNIDDIVTFYGPVYDDQIKSNFYLEADFYILPSFHEGFPRTVYEAMIFGTPIITTFVGGMASLMKHKYNCLEIKKGSPESITETVKYALINYDEIGILAKNATKTIKTVIAKERDSHAVQLYKQIQLYVR